MTIETANTAEDLLARLSLAEKVGQLNQLWGPMLSGSIPTEEVRAGKVGSVLYVYGAKDVNELQRVAVEESPTGIPLLIGYDVTHGYATIFPGSLAITSSWNPDLVERSQAVAAKEARAAGINWTFYPMLDVSRDPRWGRIVEGVGEDPYLGAAMAAAHVRGFQGDDLSSHDRIAACAKHFIGYGAPDGGRDYDGTSISESELQNVYLPPFKAAVDAGVATIMNAYTDFGDIPVTVNPHLLRGVLREQLGFDGFVVSDAGTIGNVVTQGVARDKREAALKALQAGVNMDMGSTSYIENLVGLVEDGSLTEAEIDEAVRPILQLKIDLGLFENPYVDEALYDQVAGADAHRALARTAAEQSIVLLKNDGGVLPLARDGRRIAVIGDLADSRASLEGLGAMFAKPEAITVLEGIRAATDAEVLYAPGPQTFRADRPYYEELTPGVFPWRDKTGRTDEENDAAIAEAVDTAGSADVIVMVLGETDDMSSEYSSRATLDLPGRQLELLQQVVDLGKPVVLVLINGRPLTLEWPAEHVDAIVESWQLGWEGGTAVARVLFGDVNPGGKLPVTFPRSVGQVPLFYARTNSHWPEDHPFYRSRYWDSPTTPLYPFGFGLSYSTFEYGEVAIASATAPRGGTITASVPVTNTGNVDGDEVVQLYIHQRVGRGSRPVRELKGFQRVHIPAGDTRTVEFTIGPAELKYWSTLTGTWIQDSAEFDLWIGSDSTATAHTEFEILE